MFTVILLSLILILWMYNYYVQYGKTGRLINLIPGPPAHPISGHVLKYISQFSSRVALWKLLRSLYKDNYPIFKLWAFSVPLVYIGHPDDLETILSSTKHIEKSILYDIFHPWMHTGLLTSGGTKWHLRRKILTPSFHFTILKQFTEILIEEAENMAKSMKDTGGTVVKDLLPLFSEHTLNAICETAMGTSLKSLGEFQQQYRQAVHRMGELFVYR
ncbi:PREDICTED: cytochrome P450 4C1-like [Vollenhovia emeryi]|uniref:cytochrome P450 4C1-like n=2 Tax=Vollenhovia emeryi TaxID=411798 RepID=UPI0005F3D192|nr:PREDICTED: cytochrome P450 4C1-like [Vollenhovia emeryi]XP_011883814.1 PREDICTED: cytochrome P450 4C1-like [Vollenhovia emeryi]